MPVADLTLHSVPPRALGDLPLDHRPCPGPTVPHAFSEQVLAVSYQHHRLMRVSALSQPERGGELCKEG